MVRRSTTLVGALVLVAAFVALQAPTSVRPPPSQSTPPPAIDLGGFAVSRGLGVSALGARPAGAPAVDRTAERVIAPPPASFSGKRAPVVAPPKALTTAAAGPASGTWAVLIGVDDYPGSDYDLRSAVADAVDVDQALASMGVPGSHRLLLRNGQVTAATIRQSVQWLADRAGPDSTAVFFYAGHVRKVGSTSESLVGADGGTVSDAALAGLLRKVAARRSWVTIAACYGGGFTEVLAPGRILTGAAAADELAYENTAFNRSYLVQYMIRHAFIEGRAPDTVQTAFAYARDAIARDYPNRQPVQFDQAGGPLDLRPPGVARPDRSSSSPPPQPGGGAPRQPAPGGDAGGGGSGGGGDPPPGRDGCSTLTLGVVRCDDPDD